MAANSMDIRLCRKCNQNLTKDAKYLGCLHIFCGPCLATMVTPNSCVCCHKCSANTQLTEDGIEGLPSCCIGKYGELLKIIFEQSCDNFCHRCKSNLKPATIYCFDCLFFLCDECHLNSHLVFQSGHKRVLSTRDMKGRDLDTILDFVGGVECLEHPGNNAISFSSAYNAPICGMHKAEYGTLQSISSVVTERHKTIRDKMKKSLEVAEVMKRRLNDLSELELTISKDKQEAIQDANEYFDQLIRNVEKRREEVIAEITHKSIPSQQKVLSEIDKQERTIEKYFDAQQLIESCMESFPSTFLLHDFRAIDWYLGHFNDKLGVKTATLRKLHSLDIPQFQPDKNLERAIRRTGSIEGGNEHIPPPKFLPKSVTSPDMSIKPALPPLPMKPQRQKRSQTNILHLNDTSGHPIQPWEIAATQTNYFILDRNTNMIHVSDMKGQIENTIMFHSVHARSTWGMALARFDKQERILVTDIHHKHVILATLSGQVLTIIHRTDKEKFGHPTGIAVNSVEKCVGIVDNQRKKVHIFTLTPHFVKSLGGDWLENPTAICCDTKGNYIVMDSTEPMKFVVLNSVQNFVKHVYPPFEEIAIEVPQNILVTREGHLYWSDTRTHSIVIIRQDGTLMDVIGGSREGGVKFRTPAGICVDMRGSLVVCDALNNCLVVL